MDKKLKIEDAIQQCLARLTELKPEQPEYKAICLNINDLSEARSKKPSRLATITPVLGIIAGYGEIVTILHWEELRVISSKAFGLVRTGFRL
jgi:hypothetical protein